MSPIEYFLLLAVFFVTALVSVVTGGTSLITVPVMLQMGMDARVAVATNMVALIFLSLGGTLPFVKSRVLHQKRLPALIGLTLIGSISGAILLLNVPVRAMPLIIATAMIVIAVFTLVKSDAGLADMPDSPTRRLETVGYVATLLLGIYGGFFSGGYVALLTASFIGFFRMTFLEAVAITKVLNLLSSLVAVAIFAGSGIIDWHLAMLLSVVSFVGAVAGAVMARRLSNLWLRRLFISAVIALAAKTLVVNVPWSDF